MHITLLILETSEICSKEWTTFNFEGKTSNFLNIHGSNMEEKNIPSNLLASSQKWQCDPSFDLKRINILTWNLSRRSGILVHLKNGTPICTVKQFATISPPPPLLIDNYWSLPYWLEANNININLLKTMTSSRAVHL